LPRAEELHIDPADVVQQWLDDTDPDVETRFVIEEWSVHPPSYHLPSRDTLLERICEEAYDNEWGEDNEEWEAAAREPDVKNAAQTLLDLIASKVSYRMADKHLRDLQVTPSDDPDNPLLDGVPTWSPSPERKDTT
jgi:hypothetical protein